MRAVVTVAVLLLLASPIQFMASLNAASYLVTLGGNEGREALMARLKELERKRDETSVEANAWVRRSRPIQHESGLQFGYGAATGAYNGSLLCVSHQARELRVRGIAPAAASRRTCWSARFRTLPWYWSPRTRWFHRYAGQGRPPRRPTRTRPGR